MTRWVVEHLGPNVPLHFTAFHPDFKMIDVGPTPPATLTRAREIALRQRRALRLHRQRARHRRWQHEVHRLRHAAHRARLVPTRSLPPDRRRLLPVVRYCAARSLRRPGRHLGRPPAPGSDRRRVTRPAARVREPAVAGRFYPGRRPRRSRATVDALLAAAPAAPAAVATASAPKAIVVPHAGYVFSGPIAASAYARLAPARATVRRVVLLGPAHRVPLDGLAAPRADILRTPLGDVPVDIEARAIVAALPGVAIDDAPHAGEHSLEVHLPFLQRTFAAFSVLPLVVGVATAEAVAAVLDAVWGGPETLIVVSSDLSHYEPHDRATAHDIRTVDAILAGRIDAIGTRRRVRRGSRCAVWCSRPPATASDPSCSTGARRATPRARAIASSVTPRSRSARARGDGRARVVAGDRGRRDRAHPVHRPAAASRARATSARSSAAPAPRSSPSNAARRCSAASARSPRSDRSGSASPTARSRPRSTIRASRPSTPRTSR